MSTMVNIPGYRIERQLGRGGMANVYLAVQESVQRRVALKVMSQVLLVDDAFSERFVREARIAANLTHPHIVAVHDVGVHEVHHYIAMEYLPGGDLAHECEQGVETGMALRIVKEIASALEYAHRKGFVHRDVKPENILFRENASAVLTDFGIARAVNSATQMTKTGAVIGTPQYMSPEQARGKDLDGRSDLYALGVVFYEMLTGSVPYEGADSVAVGIKHVTEPVPKLPAGMSRIQPVIERFLAKNPDQRYATGGEAYVDLQRLEERLGKQPIIRASTAADTQAAMPAIVVDEPLDKKPEPQIGQLDDLSIEHDHRRARPPRKRRSFGAGLSLLVLIVTVAAAWFWREEPPMSGWLAKLGLGERGSMITPGQPPVETGADDARIEVVDDQGPGDLTRVDLGGRIERAGDAASQIEPPQLIAAEQTGVITDAIERALTAGQFDSAQARLNELRALNAADPAIAKLQSQLDTARQLAADKANAARAAAAEAARKAEAREQLLQQRLTEAKAATKAGRWSAPAENNAVDLYRQVLELDANNPHARRGLQEVAQHYVDEAEAALEADELEKVGALIAKVQQVAPDAQALTQIRRRLTLYRQQRVRNQTSAADQAQIEQSLAAAEQAMAVGQLMQPPGESAFDRLKAVLRLDPDHSGARQQINQLATRLTDEASRSLTAGLLDEALVRIDQARQVNPSNGALPELEANAASRAANAADIALNEGRLDDAARRLDQAERLQPGLPQLEQLHLRLSIARETG